ncbi:hypothetical protein K8354_13290 [Polaribacter litorisediminis]|uniref:hypothetical protein n=1 Tax=Polaribacter litorisediminis TaxID=1908341 RepID=UPI001CBB73A8|nr:hypothetical protein [Polaribacter litorisediminis]UAM97288.1 hypothetical protein K8354_13290 [Polaribacter litorisediminis]
METRLYCCDYCKKEFLPTRRKVQKFCSNSCRSKSHHQKTKVSKALSTLKGVTKTEKTSIDKISLAGVGNSAIGNLAVNLAEKLLTAEENKPATKKDIQSIANKLKRYHLIKNMRPNFNGQRPYFDVELGVLLYL